MTGHLFEWIKHRASIESPFSLEALRTGIYINAAAIGALIAFSIAEASKLNPSSLKGAMISFAVGFSCAVFATGLSFFYSHSQNKKIICEVEKEANTENKSLKNLLRLSIQTSWPKVVMIGLSVGSYLVF